MILPRSDPWRPDFLDGPIAVDWNDPINDALKLWIPMNEKAGGYANDIVSRHTGTLTSMDSEADWIITPHGYGLQVDGNSEYVRTVTPDVLGLDGVTAQTVSMWFNGPNASASPQLNIFRYGGYSASKLIGFFHKTGTLWFGTWGSDFDSGISLSDDTWYHAVVSFDGASTCRTYVNGVGGNSATRSLNIGTDVIDIGWLAGDGAAYAFDGKMRDARIWRRLLTDSEVRRLYEEPWAGGITPEGVMGSNLWWNPTISASWSHKFNTVPAASISKINTVPIANVSKLNTVA